MASGRSVPRMATTSDPLDTRTPTAAFSMRLRVLLDNVPGSLGRLGHDHR